MNRIIALMMLAALVAACGGGGSNNRPPVPPVVTPPPPPPPSEFTVSVTNFTNAQPPSPISVVAHDGTFRLFTIGSPASAGLEELAEGGDGSALRNEADAASSVFLTSAGTGAIAPGAADEVSMTIDEAMITDLNLSVATMLVNTNDAFAAINNVDVSDMAIGESRTLHAIAYDAGTEADTEGPGTIPGPAVGGEGFNALRDDDADRVSMHQGVLSAMDGLATSVLTEQHRWDNPVASITVTRVN